MEKTREQLATQVSVNTIIGNVILTVLKLIAGIYGNSAAMISDAIHSLSDVLSTVVVIIGVNLANKKADKKHPYGHERFECVAALLLSVMLFAVGGGIGFRGMKTILAGHYEALAIPSALALMAAMVSIAVKEGMYWYTRAAAKKLRSSALMADAWHHRSDALSSIGSFLGILGARVGFPVLDSVACLLICLFIIKVSYDVFLDAINKMIDHACDDETIETASNLILAIDGVHSIDSIQTRLFGDKFHIDIEISVDEDTTLIEGHKIAHCVEDAIKENFQNVKRCMVHVNPETKTATLLS